MSVLLVAVLLFPLILALALSSRVLRMIALTLAPVAALPALLLVRWPVAEINLPWLLFGTHLGVDTINTHFLLLAGLLWTAAGFYSQGYMVDDPDRGRFQFFYLLTLTGNLGLILALDMVSFYLFFTLMTFSAYGLIVHDGNAEARRAGRVYLILAVLGELLLLTAVWSLAAQLGNPDWQQLETAWVTHLQRGWIIGLVLLGFGIKAGLVPLHVWLPLAHSYAPTPASAVLSGIIIKAGLLGWLRFLPLGEMALSTWGQIVLAVGMFSTFYGVLAGLPQVRPKTVLAYSSVSQMGLITALLGIGLTDPRNWPFLAAVLVLFSLHHGLAKGALFLGTGIAAQKAHWATWLLVLPALVLAGAPLSSGYLVKSLFQDAAQYAPGVWADRLPLLLSLSSAATTLLMIRFLYLVWPDKQPAQVVAWLWLPWLGLLVVTLELPWLWAERHLPGSIGQALQPPLLLSSGVPLLTAATLATLAWLGWRRWRWHLPALPEGDILALFTPIASLLAFVQSVRPRRYPARRRSYRGQLWLKAIEQRMQQVGIGGILLLLLGVVLVVLLAV
jgi:formate hydrogenlyase subunit 3/multisubunit Na+/H+ antiporter MnhD subunit